MLDDGQIKLQQTDVLKGFAIAIAIMLGWRFIAVALFGKTSYNADGIYRNPSCAPVQIDGDKVSQGGVVLPIDIYDTKNGAVGRLNGLFSINALRPTDEGYIICFYCRRCWLRSNLWSKLVCDRWPP